MATRTVLVDSEELAGLRCVRCARLLSQALVDDWGCPEALSDSCAFAVPLNPVIPK